MDLDCIPNGLYVPAGDPGQLQLARLLLRAKAEGRPMSWRGGFMWFSPRKPSLLLSPLNSTALLCVDLKADRFSAATRKADVPFLQAFVEGNQSGAI